MLSNKSNHQKKNQKLKLVNPLHKALDTFIQTCLNKFKFVDPPKHFENINEPTVILLLVISQQYLI